MTPAPAPAEAVRTYLEEVRRRRATGHATDELSFYAPLNNLLDALVARQRPRRRALGSPRGIEGDFPDVALYEEASNMLVLPLEVKGSDASIEAVVASAQARRYAASFGGGMVMVTNLRQFVLCRAVDGGRLAVEGEVSLAATAEDLDRPAPDDLGSAPTDLALLLELGSQVRGTVQDPRQAARFLAFHARAMRDAINGAGRPRRLLGPIQRALDEGLKIDVPTEFLVPTVVQTLVYGLFAAWLDVEDPNDFDWMEASYALDVPVFADLLHAAVRPALVQQAQLSRHLDAVARVLMWVDRDAFVTQFDGGAIEYFYEPFLAEFDSDLRDRLGVWYTPREVAEYQVARADHHLRHDLGIAAGLADPRVYVLDPACGTGTYLAAVLRHIHAAAVADNESPLVAATLTREAAVRRVIGFEILPAAFLVCHLHLGRLLNRLGSLPEPDERLRVHLTNSLTGWLADPPAPGSSLFPDLEAELQDASVVKRSEPVLVVLGNPPYQGYSSAETDEEKRMLRPWVEPLWPEWGLRKHRLNDLYVRFWRVAVEKIATLTGRGVVTFITNRKWLGGRSYPTMREAVVTGFQRVVVDDLHGAVNDTSHPGDGSVFTTSVAAGITRGTAIVTAVRTGSAERPGQVTLRDLRGSGTAKRAQLAGWAAGALDEGLAPVATSADRRWKLTADHARDFPSVDEYLLFFRSGVQPVRDEAVLDADRAVLEARMLDYFNRDLSYEELVERHRSFGVQRARYDPMRTRSRLLDSSMYRPERVVPFLYRPFDQRWLYWEPEHKLLNEPRAELIPYWLAVPNQRCLVLPQTPRRAGAFRPVVSRAPASFAAAEPDARLFPLYEPGTVLHGTEGQLGSGGEDGSETAPRLLVAPEMVAAARSAGAGGDDTAVGQSVFYALVAVMNAPDWLTDQPVDADDFPDVPLPADPGDLAAAAAVGRRIADLNDPAISVDGATTGRIDPRWAGIGVPDNAAGTVALANGRKGHNGGRRDGTAVLWDADHGWRGVPDEVWSFAACGFPVLPKWLSYRTDGLSAADRLAFMRLCRRIAAIRALEPDCDRLYAAAAARFLVPE